jgi:protoporphyrinogen IX oxidase
MLGVDVLWIKAFHLIFMVTWFAGLFYLPRLFVYHAQSDDAVSIARFKVMERKLLIMTHIGGLLTVIFGLGLMHLMKPQGGWFHAKLVCVTLLVFYHAYCIKLVRRFAQDANQKSHVWYRWFNEIPALLLIAIVILVVVRPF